MTYNEAMSNDFTLSEGGRRVDLHRSDIEDWKITFVDTGLHSNIGQRLLTVKEYLRNDEEFLANYSDGLSDLSLDAMIDDFHSKDSIASFVAVRTSQSFHAAKFSDDGYVTSLGELGDTDFWINGGFFVMQNSVFDYLKEGEELVEQPFSRLIKEKKLTAFPHTGYWQAMDTFKDKINFDRSYAQGDAPWQIWRK